MTTLIPIDAKTLAARLQAHDLRLIDIREADEYAREHIDGAISLPLSRLEQGNLKLEPTRAIVFHCKSGFRTNTNCARLAAHVEGRAFMLEGGLDAWKLAGLGVHTDAGSPLELNRQVQITIGALMMIGVTLSSFVNPVFILLPGMLGAGLLFAGLSGWCGMARLLAIAPWNRRLAS